MLYESKFNIVLDIDETLLTSQEETPPYTKRTHKIKINDNMIYIILRPHYKEFLEFCYDYFQRVIIWSAGEDIYVKKVVKILFNDLPYPDLVLTHKDCKIYYINGEEIDYSKPLYKLTKIYDKVDLSNTIIVDDRLKNFLYCNPFNGILIPYYKPKTYRDNEDDMLLRLIRWFRLPEVVEIEDVRYLDFSTVFSKFPPSSVLNHEYFLDVDIY